MRKFAPFILIFLFLLSCKHETSLTNVKDELAVIHQTFEKATTGMSKNDYKDMKKYMQRFRNDISNTVLNDSLRNSAKKRIHVYLAEDSLFSLQSFSQFKIPIYEEFIAKMDVDSLFTSLIDSHQKSVKIDLKTETPFYQIITKEALKDKSNYNGTLRFSRVVFNKKRTKACYYFEQNILLTPDRGWDMGTVVFAEKKNGKWMYVKDEYLFIS